MCASWWPVCTKQSTQSNIITHSRGYCWPVKSNFAYSLSHWRKCASLCFVYAVSCTLLQADVAIVLITICWFMRQLTRCSIALSVSQIARSTCICSNLILKSTVPSKYTSGDSDVISSYHIYASCFFPAKCSLFWRHFLSKILLIQIFS